jgi:hypothetical protein
MRSTTIELYKEHPMGAGKSSDVGVTRNEQNTLQIRLNPEQVTPL